MILVDNVVLPIDERETSNAIELESGTGLMDTVESVSVVDRRNREYFPIFMIGISIIQV